MKYALCATLATLLLGFSLSASAHSVVLPAGTLLQCTLNEPNFSSATAAVGDPVLCHLRSITEFGHQAFPRGAYLVGHLESDKEPGHFWGKGNLKLQFDRIGLPTGDLPLDAKVISTRGYKVDKEGAIRGKGHPKRDVVEWMLPPLWPWKVIMLPARGPRPALKGESVMSLRLMDDVELPQVAETYGPGWHFFDRRDQQSSLPQLSQRPTVQPARQITPVADDQPVMQYASVVTKQVPEAIGSTSPGTPVFVLKTGTVLAVGDYSYQDGRISYSLASGGSGVISAEQIDWATTTRVNTQRGVRLSLHGGHPTQQGTPGM
jgi:hypothetical protein